MYGVIYDKIVDAGVAIRLDFPVFKDYHRKEVIIDEQFGLQQEIQITYPHYIVFTNKTGCNTSQKKDGHVGRKK